MALLYQILLILATHFLQLSLKIDTFPCRVGIDLNKRAKNVSDDDVISNLKTAALEARSTSIKLQGERYKEIIGSIIGRRIYRQNK